MKRLDQFGSHIVAVAVAIGVIGVISFAGYTVIQRQGTTTASTASPTLKSSQSINDTADLTEAAASLDASSTQVDSSLDDSSLDADLNDLL